MPKDLRRKTNTNKSRFFSNKNKNKRRDLRKQNQKQSIFNIFNRNNDKNNIKNKSLQRRPKSNQIKRNNLRGKKIRNNLSKKRSINPPIKVVILMIIIIAILLIASFTINNTISDNKTDTTNLTTTQLGNSSIGYAEKIGPYGNTSSDIKIAYILGVHPREKGAHDLMEQAIKEEVSNASYCYYIYKVHVTQDATDFSQSRLNGQILARDFVVPDAINNSINFAIDSHYSNGVWGVQSFIFTPNEGDNISSSLGHAIAEKFNWTVYYTPDNPTSPEYVTGPLENGGVPAIIYEAYTEDTNSTTLSHDKELFKFIDSWNFTTNNTK